MHMDGKTLQQHQVFMKARLSRDPPSWEEYVRALASQFGDCVFDDSMGELTSLKQKGSIQDYQDQFKEFLNRVKLTESYVVSYFLSGLKEEMQLSVKMFMPRTIQHAKTLARLEETKILNALRKIKTFQKFEKSPRNFQGNKSQLALFPTSEPILSGTHKKNPLKS